MKRRITSLLLVVVMVLTMSISASAINTPFTDLAQDWYKPAVQWAYGHNVTSGITKTTFGPESPITRGMLVSMLYRIEGSPPVSGSSGFTDVPSDKYYANAITWAAQNDIVSGRGNNQFAPEDNITREDIVAILYRYADKPSFAKVADFSDMSEVSNYAKTAVQWAKANNVVSGKGENLFAPKADATRAEMAQILYKYFGHDYSVTTKAATCTENGTKTYTCSVCGDSYTESIPATGHNWQTETIHHDAVYGTRDVTETWTHATVIYGFSLTTKGFQEWPELGNYGNGNTHAVKVTEFRIKGTTGPKGYNDPLWDDVEWIYSYKDAEKDAEDTLKKDVTMGWYEVNGVLVNVYPNYFINGANYSGRTDTYTEERIVGSESYVITPAYDEKITTCTVCGASDHNHTYTETVTKAATCTEPGTKTLTCSGCGQSHTEGIPLKEHSLNESGRCMVCNIYPNGRTPDPCTHIRYSYTVDGVTYDYCTICDGISLELFNSWHN